MEVNVREIIGKEVERLNILFQKGANVSKKKLPPFTIADYTYLDESQSYYGRV